MTSTNVPATPKVSFHELQSKYQADVSALNEKHGAFFAFSDKQIAEQANHIYYKDKSKVFNMARQEGLEIANMVEETTSTIRGTAETAHHLEIIANTLKQQMSKFRI